MRYGIDAINFGAYGEPGMFQQVARIAEGAGWDGLFCWDHVASAWEHGPPTADPWILLTAAACVTERLIVGTNVTPVPRRRPHILAGQVATLDRLSGGRVRLGVGLGGVPAEFEKFGGPSDDRARGEILDESLEIMTGPWSGEVVRFTGRHVRADGVQNRLVPVQRPRVPIWVGGDSPAARRRAARWDGWTIALFTDESGRITLAPDFIAGRAAAIATHRESGPPEGRPFDVVVAAYSDAGAAGARLAAEYADAGATWWLEEINGYRGSPEEMLARIKAGPPA